MKNVMQMLPGIDYFLPINMPVSYCGVITSCLEILKPWLTLNTPTVCFGILRTDPGHRKHSSNSTSHLMCSCTRDVKVWKKKTFFFLGGGGRVKKTPTFPGFLQDSHL